MKSANCVLALRCCMRERKSTLSPTSEGVAGLQRDIWTVLSTSKCTCRPNPNHSPNPVHLTLKRFWHIKVLGGRGVPLKTTRRAGSVQLLNASALKKGLSGPHLKHTWQAWSSSLLRLPQTVEVHADALMSNLRGWVEKCHFLRLRSSGHGSWYLP